MATGDKVVIMGRTNDGCSCFLNARQHLRKRSFRSGIKTSRGLIESQNRRLVGQL